MRSFLGGVRCVGVPNVRSVSELSSPAAIRIRDGNDEQGISPCVLKDGLHKVRINLMAGKRRGKQISDG